MLNKYRKFLISLMLFLLIGFSSNSWAYTECSATPNRVWLNLGANSVWICFEGANCIYKTQDSVVTEAHLNRMYSTALAAISRDSQLVIRYPEDNGNCSLLLSTSRNDIQGIWFQK